MTASGAEIDQHAQDLLYAGKVAAVAVGFVPDPCYHREDVVSTGVLKALEAEREADPSNGGKKGWVRQRAKWRTIDEIRTARAYPFRQNEEELRDVSEGESILSDLADDEAARLKLDMMEVMRSMLDHDEKRVLDSLASGINAVGGRRLVKKLSAWSDSVMSGIPCPESASIMAGVYWLRAGRKLPAHVMLMDYASKAGPMAAVGHNGSGFKVMCRSLQRMVNDYISASA